MQTPSPNILYITTFNDVLYEKSGKALVDSFADKSTHGDLLVCYEDFEFDETVHGTASIMKYNMETDAYMNTWLDTHKDIIPEEYGGCAPNNSSVFDDPKPDRWNPKGQVWAKYRASRYFRKIVALNYALKMYADKYDIFYIIDSDCIFKKGIPSTLSTSMFSDGSAMVYFWGAFRKRINRGPETGFTGYCKKNGGFAFAKTICDTFETGKFLEYQYWDDGFVVGRVIDEAAATVAAAAADTPDIVLKDLVGESTASTTRVMEIQDNVLFDYVHHFKNKHKSSV
jgi:hypothetical protein